MANAAAGRWKGLLKKVERDASNGGCCCCLTAEKVIYRTRKVNKFSYRKEKLAGLDHSSRTEAHKKVWYSNRKFKHVLERTRACIMACLSFNIR